MKTIPLLIAFLLLVTSIAAVSSGVEEVIAEAPDEQRSGSNEGHMEREHFIEGHGHLSRDDIRYYSMGSLRAGFTDRSVVYAIDGDGTYSYEVEFVDRNEVEPTGIEEEVTKYNFFLGNDPGSWVSNASCYRKVLYEDLWNGIDLLFYCYQGSLKYDLIVSPFAEVTDIRFHVIGAEITTSSDGQELLFDTPFGTISDGNLIAYQESGEVPVSFEIDEYGTYTFSVDEYDREEILVIDPLLRSLTYLGGSNSDYISKGFDQHNGDIIISGYTSSSDFPTKPGAIKDTIDNWDIFLSRMGSTQSNLVYSTFIGGNNRDYCNGMVADPSGNVYITGTTYSLDLPTTTGAMNETSNIVTKENEWGYLETFPDSFVMKIDSSGSSISYCTYLGGTDHEMGVDICVDLSKNAYVTGITYSTDHPTVNAYDNELTGNCDTYLMKLDPQGSSAVFSTYLGGNDAWREDVYDIHVDELGRATLVGWTEASDFPTTSGAYKTSFSTARGMGYLTRFTSGGSDLDLSTFLDGEVFPTSTLFLDDGILIGGYTSNTALPVTPDAVDKTTGGWSEGFLIKLNKAGSTLDYCSYFGGSGGQDIIEHIEMDGNGNILVIGSTESGDLQATMGAPFETNQGYMDGFICMIAKDLSKVEIFTYFGGTDYDEILWAYPYKEDILLFAGSTYGSDLPITNNAFDKTSSNGEIFAGSIKFNSFIPLPPMNLSIERDDSTLTLTWDPPLDDGNETITNYTVHMSKNNWTFEEIIRIDASGDLEYVHTHLDNGDRYYYYITATNIVGGSLPSIIRSSVPARPPSIPELSSISTGDRTASLEWNYPDDFGGDYDITFNIYSGARPDEMEVLINGLEDLEFTHTNLTNGQTYYYSISASNSIGEGGMTTPIPAVPMKIPSSPLNLSIERGSRYIHLFWEPPADNGGEEALTYNVYIKGGSSDGPMDIRAERLSKPALNITDLINGKYYDIMVTAKNGKGEGAASDIITAKPIGIPGEPRDLTIEVSDWKAYLTWREPSDIGGGDDVDYNVYILNPRSGPELIAERIETEEYRISGLDNGVSYDLYVTAVNAIFEGERSGIVSGIPVGPPGEPRDLSINAGDGTADLSWSPPLHDGGDSFLSYKVYMGPKADDLSEVLETNGFQYSVDELTNGKTYFFGVKATNSFGPGHFSEIVRIVPMTAPGIPEIIFHEAGNGSIHLSWTPPTSNGGFSELRYNIYLDSDRDPLHLHVDNVSGTSYTLTDLNNGVEYKIGIVAFNPLGEGLMSDTITAVPIRPPPEPLVMNLTKGKGFINVSWELPDDNGGCPISEIMVYRWEEEGDPILIATVKGSISSYIDHTVKDEVKYHYMVVGRTSAGVTPDSNIEIESSFATDKDGLDLTIPAIMVFVVLLLVMIVGIVLSSRKKEVAVPQQDMNLAPYTDPQMALQSNTVPAALPIYSSGQEDLQVLAPADPYPQQQMVDQDPVQY